MSRFTRRNFSLGVASVVACGRIEKGNSPTAASDAGLPPLPDCGDGGVVVPFPAFSEEGISNAAPIRRRLYTWTTTAQADALASDRVLYTRITDDNGRKGFLFDSLEQLVTYTSDPIVKMLTQPEFERGRYAWPIPWATQMSEEDYGRELVQIDFTDDAWFVSFDPKTDWNLPNNVKAFDLENSPISLDAALAAPERIAGIFFSNGIDGGSCGTAGGSPGYREFHLCHESTVAEWSLRTEETLDVVHRSIRVVSDLIAGTRGCDVALPACAEFLALWSRAEPPQDDIERFCSCIAFAYPFGQPSPATVFRRALGRLQEAVFEPRPIRHRPNG
jgi:hypothetical protein